VRAFCEGATQAASSNAEPRKMSLSRVFISADPLFRPIDLKIDLLRTFGMCNPFIKLERYFVGSWGRLSQNMGLETGGAGGFWHSTHDDGNALLSTLKWHRTRSPAGDLKISNPPRSSWHWRMTRIEVSTDQTKTSAFTSIGPHCVEHAGSGLGHISICWRSQSGARGYHGMRHGKRRQNLKAAAEADMTPQHLSAAIAAYKALGEALYEQDDDG
jgi:hypothetical protein